MGQVVWSVLGVVLPLLLMAFGFWVVQQLIKQNGRILLRLEAIEAKLGEIAAGAQRAGGAAPAPAEAAPQGLAVGSPAPAFELPDLSGKVRSLAEFRGRRVLFVFFGPRCGFCIDMLPKLAALSTDPAAGGPMPLVLTSGDLEENRRMFGEHKVGCPVLVQKQLEVASQYQAFGTPVGYLIDEAGAIASELAVGADALMALAGTPAPAPAPSARAGKNGKSAHGGGSRPLSTSKLVRDGLKAGTPAPDFTLPRVGGGKLSLRDYRGRRVLLVFSDPQCGPCEAVAPRLQEHHLTGADPQVVMVSRREMAENVKKVGEAGLTFPVVLQRNWDTSKDYGMFATPIGYLIDERGVLASDVAVGAEPILALLSGGGGVAGAGSGTCRESPAALRQ
jgi:peroxiredoxin